MNDLQIFAKLFSLVGSPTANSESAMMAIKQKCYDSHDPNTLCFLMDLRPKHGIVWSKNADLVLGVDKLTVATFMNSIHTEFRNIFVIFIHAVYKSIIELPSSFLRNTAYTYNLNVPFLQADGQYYWYKMTSRPVAFDQRGDLVCHFNQHYALAEYSKMIPERPEITVNGLPYRIADDYNARSANKHFRAFLKNRLSSGASRLLNTYRYKTVLRNERWVAPKKQEIAAALKMTLPTLDRAIGRLLAEVRTFYPAHAVRNIADLSIQLNELFGEPVQDAPH